MENQCVEVWNRSQGRRGLVSRGEAHVRTIYIETIAATLDIRGQICGSIGSIGLSHACLPFVKVFPSVSARGSNVHTGVVAGLDNKSVPCPSVLLGAMELHMSLSPRFVLLILPGLWHGEVNAAHIVGVVTSEQVVTQPEAQGCRSDTRFYFRSVTGFRWLLSEPTGIIACS